MAPRRNGQRRQAIYDYVKCNSFRYIVHTTLRSFSVSSNYRKMRVRYVMACVPRYAMQKSRIYPLIHHPLNRMNRDSCDRFRFNVRFRDYHR